MDDDRLERRMQVVRMSMGYWTSKALHAAAKLGIADLLAGGPKTLAELAAATNTHAPSLGRLMRAMVSAGIFAEADDGAYRTAALGESLESGARGSLRGWAISLGEEQYRAWDELMHSLQTGQTAFPRVFGVDVHEYLATHEDALRAGMDAMTGSSELVFAAAIEAYDFGRFDTLVDVGGAHGALLAAILQAHPRLRGVLFDLPAVVGGAAAILEAPGVRERCTVAPGDALERIPEGGDAYLLSRFLLGFPDEAALQILRNCHRAMRGRGTLLLLERYIDQVNAMAPWFDLNQLVVFGGGERTIEDFDRLLQAAGFRRTGIIRTRSPMDVHILEAEPV